MKITKEELKNIDENILINFKNLCIQYPNECVAWLWSEAIDNNYIPNERSETGTGSFVSDGTIFQHMKEYYPGGDIKL
jgi:hypothetical protein